MFIGNFCFINKIWIIFSCLWNTGKCSISFNSVIANFACEIHFRDWIYINTYFLQIKIIIKYCIISKMCYCTCNITCSVWNSNIWINICIFHAWSFKSVSSTTLFNSTNIIYVTNNSTCTVCCVNICIFCSNFC